MPHKDFINTQYLFLIFNLLIQKKNYIMRNVGVSVKNRQNATCGVLVNVVVSVVKHIKLVSI